MREAGWAGGGKTAEAPSPVGCWRRPEACRKGTGSSKEEGERVEGKLLAEVVRMQTKRLGRREPLHP
jgi:hypothetical protein